MRFKKNGLFVGMLIIVFVMSIGIVSADTQFRLAASDPVANAQFGRSVATAGDLVAVGEGGDGANGTVYLYSRQGTSYILEEKLVNPDATPEAEFGRTVAIQGGRVFVGARFAQAGDVPKAGAVYVFRKNGDTWQYEDKIISPSPQTGDNFGRALAIQGNLLVVTARKNSAERGAAYVFEKKGDRWIHKADITASDSTDGDYFGQSVALQGSFMVIGARNTDPNGAGGFYLFRQKGGQWIEIAKVTPPDGNADDQTGFAIAIAGDTIAVTARRADPAGIDECGCGICLLPEGRFRLPCHHPHSKRREQRR